jgi:DNA-binding LacI/PurR family transcriptional regulator
MSPTTPITQRDIARACGVHPSTICLALKNSPSIPVETRHKVQAVAEELGYRPNVAARNLALLRGDKTAGGSLPIAWINQEPDRHHWRHDPAARAHFEQARHRAEELGYHLEEIWAREPGMSVGRLVQIVRARGIEGVIFPVHRTFDFSLLTPAWNDFALVGFNDHRLAEWIDVVCPDHYRNTEGLCRQTRRLGCERVGLALTGAFDAATSGLVHACFLRHYADEPVVDRVPVCLLPDGLDASCALFKRWLETHEPATVITPDGALVAQAQAAGHQAVWLGLGSAAAPFDGGLDDGASQVASVAVECVVDKMRQFEKGMRESTRVHLLKGVWTEPRLGHRVTLRVGAA